MIKRDFFLALTQALDETPGVCLLGPRQTGKTTLALAIQEQREAIYLDLESERDRSKLDEAELYFKGTWIASSYWTKCIAPQACFLCY